MPNVLLKNDIGEDIEYDNVDAVNLRTVDGGNALFTFGLPKPTAQWQEMETFIKDSSLTSYYSKVTANVAGGRIISSNAPNFGTWLQTTYDATRISERNYMQLCSVGGGALLFDQSTAGKIYFYSDETREITEIYSTGGYYLNVLNLGEKQLLICYMDWFIFHPEDHSITLLKHFIRSNTTYNLYIDDGILLARTGDETADYNGLYFLDKNTLELTRSFDEGFSWLCMSRPDYSKYSYMQGYLELDDCYLISSNTTSTGCKGILRYDKTTHMATRLCDVGYNFFYENDYTRYTSGTSTRYVKNHGVAIGCNYDPSAGEWWYSYETKTLIKVTEGTAFFNAWFENEDILIGTYSSYGCAVYNKNTKQWCQPATTGTYTMAAFVDGGVVITSNTTTYGARYYDFTSKTLTTLNTSYGWYWVMQCSGGCLLSTITNNTGVWFFDEKTKKLSQLNNNGCYWVMKRWQDKVIMGSYQSSVMGFFYYNNGTLTYKQPNPYDRMMRCIEVVDDGWVIGQSNSYSFAYFVDGETGESKTILNSIANFGIYYSNIWGIGGYAKKNYDFNIKVGRYRIISSYDSRGFFFDDINHEVVNIYNFQDNLDEPTLNNPQQNTNMQRIMPFYLAPDKIFLLSGGSYSLFFNPQNGTAYLYNTVQCFTPNSYNYEAQPLYKWIPTDDGYLLFFPPVDRKLATSAQTGSPGIFYFNNTKNKLKRVHNVGYYDSYEEAPGGLYIYNSYMPFANRVYWDAASHTCTVETNS